MSSVVRTLNVTYVLPDRATANPPPAAPHADDGVVKLSFFDLLYVTMAPMQSVFFYEGPNLQPFPSIVQSLRSSLATTLATFTPLSGKLTYLPSSREVVIDCSAAAVSPGVKFVEAEHCGAVDLRRIAGNDEHHTKVFTQLIPEVGPAGQLPAPVLAVQVTRSAAGDAVAVGVSMHHSVCDGRSFYRFMHAWARAAREGSPQATGLVRPIFNREAIRDPRVQELTRKSMRVFAAKTPVDPFPFPPADVAQQRRRTFWLDARRIQSLKQRQWRRGTGVIVEPPSTFVAVASLVWTSIVRAKSMDQADDCYLLLSADIRSRLRPPVDEGYFGNCVMGCLARATVADLLSDGDDGLVRAALAIQTATREDLEDPMANVEDRLACRRGLPAERVTVLGSSNQFRPYETDFGWGGAPPRVEMVSMTVMEEVAMRGAPNGGVQLSVALDRTHMETVASNIKQVSELVQVSRM
ncbi:hypothetical protein EJB05_22418, partial [Eragrostis curvula]